MGRSAAFQVVRHVGDEVRLHALALHALLHRYAHAVANALSASALPPSLISRACLVTMRGQRSPRERRAPLLQPLQLQRAEAHSASMPPSPAETAHRRAVVHAEEYSPHAQRPNAKYASITFHSRERLRNSPVQQTP
jgi:hypothetical protein